MKSIRPDNITVTNNNSELTIIRKNFRPLAILLLFFCLLWDGFLISWFIIVLSNDTPLMAKLSPLFHVAIGICLTYITVTMFVNTIIITMDTNHLNIIDYPLPLGNTKKLDLGKVDNFYPHDNTSMVRRITTYEVYAKLNSGSKIKVIGGLYSTQESKYIATKLNNKKRNVI